jgi:hypothetical protein
MRQRTRKYKRARKQSSKRYKRYIKKSFSKNQKGGFIKHPAITNPLYGSLVYFPTSIGNIFPSFS